MHRYIPSPTVSAVHFGFLTIHFYALAILLGIIAAISIGRFRYERVGGDPEEITDIAIWAIPAGIVGGRAYHVLTSPDAYFGAQGKPLDALKIWQGGMGIWGAVALGTAVSYIAFKSKPRSLTFPHFLDALAPGLLLAQAIGRWGNWFNIELFGKPSTFPWALQVPIASRPHGYENFSTFHPTFLYESLWCLFGALIILSLPKARQMQPGKIFLGYAAFYCLGRLGIESLRIDPAHTIGGLRLNIWVSLIGIGTFSYLFFKSSTIGKLRDRL